MFCSRCGAATPENATFCASCGQALGPIPPEAVGTKPSPVFAAPGTSLAGPPITPPVVSIASTYPANVVPVVSPYAGFWLRFVAYIIDSVLISLGLLVFVVIAALILGGAGFFRNFGNFDEDMNGAQNVMAAMGILMILLLVFVGIAGVWIYYAWFESSQHQGTLGKMALGLIVTDEQGRRVSFARASGRFFAKFITGLIPFFIGYIMAGFTQRKQALHDMIASCLVLRRT